MMSRQHVEMKRKSGPGKTKGKTKTASQQEGAEKTGPGEKRRTKVSVVMYLPWSSNGKQTSARGVPAPSFGAQV